MGELGSSSKNTSGWAGAWSVSTASCVAVPILGLLDADDGPKYRGASFLMSLRNGLLLGVLEPAGRPVSLRGVTLGEDAERWSAGEDTDLSGVLRIPLAW